MQFGQSTQCCTFIVDAWLICTSQSNGSAHWLDLLASPHLQLAACVELGADLLHNAGTSRLRVVYELLVGWHFHNVFVPSIWFPVIRDF